MQDVIAPVDNIVFDIEIALNNQTGAQPLPFPGMDKSGAAICTFFLTSGCSKATACPFRHVKGDRTVVCKHWLRGLCKKGDDCEFLHEYDMSKMPECFFFSKFGLCNNKECPFLHIDPDKKLKDCPWYDRGYCRHGPHCKNRHVRRLICQCYLSGFCLDGPNCKYMHPKYDLPPSDPTVIARKQLVCHTCGEAGHKSFNCPTAIQTQIEKDAEGKPVVDKKPIGAGIPGSGTVYGRGTFHHHGMVRAAGIPHTMQNTGLDEAFKRNLEGVTCYKCGEKGHYANRCPKGALSFLTNPSS